MPAVPAGAAAKGVAKNSECAAVTGVPHKTQIRAGQTEIGQLIRAVGSGEDVHGRRVARQGGHATGNALQPRGGRRTRRAATGSQGGCCVGAAGRPGRARTSSGRGASGGDQPRQGGRGEGGDQQRRPGLTASERKRATTPGENSHDVNSITTVI